MNADDFIYLFILFSSIAFGPYYRKIENNKSKQKWGAILGFVIVVVVSRLHFIHIVISILVNALIILYGDKKYCHVISFTFSFVYLIFFRTTVYFGIPYPPSHTNLIQMILTLKLVGLAFEVNSAHNIEKKHKSDQDEPYDLKKLELIDICYYGLNYIGVLTGPYYKYKTYCDHLHKPFHRYDDYKTATYKKLFPLVPILVLVYLLTDYLFPLSYTQSLDFEEETFFYRYWYIWPTFLNFRMRIYIGLILSECVCVMGGLGVYPTFVKSTPGNGPTLELQSANKDNLKALEYDYETVHSINVYGTEFYLTLREGMKNWNMTVQYWLATCIYKRFPSRKLRTFATFFVSGWWHGVYSGYHISTGMVPFGLMVEDVWALILLKNEVYLPKKAGYLIMLFLKMQFFSYAAIAFSLQEVHKILHYYNLVYHWMIPFCICMYFAGKYLIKSTKKSMEPNNIKSDSAD